jgi:eukaryotic-like serine/threonine-protein kinase
MPILSGRRLGPYEILSAIGAGGMGEVYKARDTRLERIVAIKVLPAHLADRAELRERFDREAKTIASLNHPHICTLYDTGHQDDIDFLVMEYLEGETLAQRLLKVSLPIQQVLQHAIEIADALDKAHRKGVTHRDLKPGNIMLTKTGTKLLDFGLAKLKQEAVPANAQLSELPTAIDPLTAEGTIVGTLQYMAPEQLEGKEVDARTDIFAFGVVVYEMATRKRAFEGKSQASVISAIMSSDPVPMSSLQPMTPPALDRVVRRCLAKDREDRWQTARDLEVELKWIAESGSQAGVSVPSAAVKGIRTLGRRALISGLGISLLGAAIAVLAIWNLKPSPLSQAISRFTITLPPGQQLAGLDGGPAVALSSDGSHVAYVARQGSTQQIYLRAMDSLEVRPITGTEGAVNPFFSPDGQWLGFFAGGKLKKVSLNGGAAVPLTSVSTPGGASWSSQGMIALQATIGASIGLQQVSEEGGTPQPLTKVGRRGEPNHGWPEFLPGGKALLFARSPVYAAWNNAQIAVQLAGTGEPRNLVAGSEPRYATTGHLLFARVGTLMAAPFDARRLELTGVAVPALEGVMQSNFTGAAQYSVSSTGTLVYIAGGFSASESRLVWVTRNGEEQLLPAAPHNYQFPRVSPDGGRVAVAIAEQEQQIWVYDLSRDTLTRLTFEGVTNNTSVWSPDGKRIAFNSDRATGPLNLFWRAADGSGDVERLTTSDYLNAPSSFSPDGQLLVFQDNNPETGRDIWVLRLSDRKAQPFLRTPYEDTAPKFSPDGKWLAYSSNESGRREIYVQPYPGPGGGKWQISTDGGQEPVWNPKGRELFYRSGSKIMTVEVDTKSGFSVGKPRMLFEGPYLPTSASFPYYDVSPDGQRFLMLKPTEQAQAAPTQINVVLNWFEELKQKVPTGKK